MRAEPNMREAALRLGARGWSVLPLHTVLDAHCSCGHPACDSPGKHPRTDHGVKDATTDEVQIRSWFERWPGTNLGIATGPISGLVVVDVDGPEGEGALRELGLALPPTLEVQTGRGRHLYYTAPDGATKTLAVHLDVRGAGAYVVAPPLIHASGRRYEWLGLSEPAPAPTKLLALLQPNSNAAPGTRESTGEAASPQMIVEGQRNRILASLAGTMRKRGMASESIEAALLAENQARCEPPLTDREVLRIARSVGRYQPAADASVPEITFEEARALLPDVLFEVAGFLQSYLAISEAQRDVLSLWVVHTHVVVEAFDRTPYLNIFSPEKRSGKTLLLDLLALLVCKPWFTSNATSAALARKIAEVKPTALIDEADTFFFGDGERAEMLRGILNAGYARGGTFSRCVGQGAALHVEDMPVFGAKAIAGLRELPDTIGDRSIPIRMKRATPGEVRCRFYRRQVEPVAAVLRKRIEMCTAAVLPSLKEARPQRIDELNDRQGDISEPLLATADLAGGEWPERARAALRKLFAPESDEQSIGTRLLSDLREIFAELNADRLETTALIQSLYERPDAPWMEYSRGKAITGHALGRVLARYGVRPTKWWQTGRTVRGYGQGDFDEVWKRYLPPPASGNGVQNARTPEACGSEGYENQSSGALAVQSPTPDEEASDLR